MTSVLLQSWLRPCKHTTCCRVFEQHAKEGSSSVQCLQPENILLKQSILSGGQNHSKLEKKRKKLLTDFLPLEFGTSFPLQLSESERNRCGISNVTFSPQQINAPLLQITTYRAFFTSTDLSKCCSLVTTGLSLQSLHLHWAESSG